MSVKLEVGKWYQHEYSYHGTFLQLVDPCVRDDETIGMYNPAEPNNDWRSIPSYLRGPHSIEPGDVVKPKPAEDKCWKGHDWGIGQGEFTVDGVDRVNWNYGEWGDFEGNNILGDGKNWPISTLILVRKAEKAQPEDWKQKFPIGSKWKTRNGYDALVREHKTDSPANEYGCCVLTNLGWHRGIDGRFYIGSDPGQIQKELSSDLIERIDRPAQPRPETDFQVGDEVEMAQSSVFSGLYAGGIGVVLSAWDGTKLVVKTHDGHTQWSNDPKTQLKLIRRAGEIKAENTTRVWIRPGHGHAFPTPNGTKTYENHSDKAVEVEFCHNTGLFKQVNRAAGVGPTEPTSGVLNKGTISASPAAPKLNPATLPSLSGSELVWPDVKCEKPTSNECRLCSGGYNYWMNYMGDDSELFAQFQGLAMGFDCGPLNRCIPCIECHTEKYRQTMNNFIKFKRSIEPI